MKIYGVNKRVLIVALRKTNEIFDKKIKMNIEEEENDFKIELTTINGTGGKIETNEACWHVECTFIDNILKFRPNSYIKINNKKITCQEENWEEIYTNGEFESNLCNCNKTLFPTPKGIDDVDWVFDEEEPEEEPEEYDHVEIKELKYDIDGTYELIRDNLLKNLEERDDKIWDTTA